MFDEAEKREYRRCPLPYGVRIKSIRTWTATLRVFTACLTTCTCGNVFVGNGGQAVRETGGRDNRLLEWKGPRQLFHSQGGSVFKAREKKYRTERR